MAETKGPKVDIPDELVAEMDEKPAAQETADETEPSTEGEGSDAPAPEGDASVEASSEGLQELNDKYLRLAAEFDNFRRRTLKERQDLLNYGNENLIKELLGTIDNLERALAHRKDGESAADAETLHEGVELTHRSLLQALGKYGVQVVEAEGKAFDPSVHEAIRQDASPDYAPGTVTAVYQTGYTLMDRLLRPALVAVAGPGSGSEGGE